MSGYNKVYTCPSWGKVFEELHEKRSNHFWTKPNVSKFSDDVHHWSNMSRDVKHTIKMVVHALNRMEPEVADNVTDVEGAMRDQHPGQDLGPFYALLSLQHSMEYVHMMAYSLIDELLEIDDFTPDEITFIERKVNLMKKYRYQGDGYTLSRSIVANICAEGIAFNTLFSFFFYLDKDGYLPGTCMTNAEVLTDENIHTTSFITAYNVFTHHELIPKLGGDEIRKIICEYVAVSDIASEEILGNCDESFFTIMNVENSKIYTRIIANSILVSLGVERLYSVTEGDNPWPFTTQSQFSTLTSFFDKPIRDYGLDVDGDEKEYDSDPE